MFNMHSNKNKKVFTTIMIIILTLAMVLPTVAAALAM